MNIRGIISEQKGVPMVDVMGIVSYVLSLTREVILADTDRLLDEADEIEIRRCIGERKNGKPFAYITGRKEFFSFEFLVNEDVLIPRPETELLVDEVLRIIEKQPDIKDVVDMGTGSGAIGIVVAKLSHRKVVCVDISQKALAVASANAHRLGVEKLTNFVCSDLFDIFAPTQQFDLIMANLPYVTDREWKALMPDVRNYEPRLALTSGGDGMNTYRKLLSAIPGRLKMNGYVVCEIGSSEQAKIVQEEMNSLGFEVSIRKDYAGKERVVIGQWINSL